MLGARLGAARGVRGEDFDASERDDWWYHWKHPDLLRANPDGMVPTITSADGRLVVTESIVCCQFADGVAAARGGAAAPRVPADPWEAARALVWASRVNTTVTSEYYKCLVRTDETERREAFDRLVEGLAHFAEAKRGTFFSGEGLGIVDCVLLPYAFRLYVLEHCRGFAVPRTGPGPARRRGSARGGPAERRGGPDKAKYLNRRQACGGPRIVLFKHFHAVSPASMCPACFAYAVTFRGPLARIVSHMRFAGLGARVAALDNFTVAPSPVWGRGSAWFTNLYVRELSGVDAYGAPPAAVGEAALAAAASAVANFDVVLILEHLGDHLAQLTCVLGWADVAEVALNGNGRASFRDVAGLGATFHDRLARRTGSTALFARAVARAALRAAAGPLEPVLLEHAQVPDVRLRPPRRSGRARTGRSDDDDGDLTGVRLCFFALALFARRRRRSSARKALLWAAMRSDRTPASA
ncbi:glutathione transferase [Aureococcus anophagefferens]|nr:glutathione transferase [Aureococcus anophagefferens]